MKRKLTLSIDHRTIRAAKLLAAGRGVSLSEFLAQQIEIIVGQEEACERAKRQALGWLKTGFHLGGAMRLKRDECHKR
ncbi:MAG TPA: DUF6364 family protein [Candidatus Dormibacteraeota bacterium]|nr:DUF6364 family protein [Candidatus Dormibacteraeota bacterium]